MKYVTHYVVILILAGVCIACASTSMQSIHRKPDFRSDEIHHVLVIGLFKDQALRKIFEEEFVRQWRAHGVNAVSSLEVLPSFVPLNKVGLAPIAKAQGYDAVLVARLLDKKRIPPGEQALAYIDPDPANNVENVNTILQVMLSPPMYAEEYDLATVQTNLYDVASEQRVWSGTSETEVMGKIPKLIAPFVKVILKHLYESTRTL